jgi:hypothetical protein
MPCSRSLVTARRRHKSLAITYTASNPLTARGTEPACVDWSHVTVETANSIHGPLPADVSRTFVQSFGHSATSGMIRKTARVMKRTVPWVRR